MASYTICDVAACAGCAFTTTEQPAANALAVSPPAVEYANGKLLAPNTTTGPNAINSLRISGLGGFLSGIAVSILASTQLPSRNMEANILNCPVVLPLSPCNLATGKLVSADACSINASPNASISVAMVSKNNALFSALIFLYS